MCKWCFLLQLYQCGPCPVAALKEGDILVAYDAPFIYAEVNSDYLVWKKFTQLEKILKKIDKR